MHLDCSLVVALAIEFWNFLSKTKWFLHKIVYNDVTNTRVVARLHSATSVHALYSKSVTLYLDAWRTSFNYLSIQRYHLLTLKDKNYKPL